MKQIGGYQLEEPWDPRHGFYEAVIDNISEEDLPVLEYEKNEEFFIKLIDTLYDICRISDPKITAQYVINVYQNERVYWNDFPEFVEETTES